MKQQNRSIRLLVRAVIAALSVTAVRSTPIEAQRAFEGVISAESYVNRQMQPETLFVKGNRWRFNGFEQGRAQREGAIVGDDKGQLLILMPSRRAYVRQPIATDIDQAANLVTFTKAGRSESVAGSQCDYYTVQFQNSAAMDRQFCIATDLGFVGFAPEVRVHEGLASLGIGAVARRKFSGGFVVLKALDKSGKVVFAVTKIDRRALGDDMFEPAAGWTEGNPSGRGRPPL